MSYENIKKFGTEHKPQLQGLAALVLVFFVGVGVGKMSGNPKAVVTGKTYEQYTTKDTAKPTKAGEITTVDLPKEDVLGQATTALTTTPIPSITATEGQSCIVKGNISSKDKIYHVKGGAFYERTTPEMCFTTEAEAKAAGFRKSSR